MHKQIEILLITCSVRFTGLYWYTPGCKKMALKTSKFTQDERNILMDLSLQSAVACSVPHKAVSQFKQLIWSFLWPQIPDLIPHFHCQSPSPPSVLPTGICPPLRLCLWSEGVSFHLLYLRFLAWHVLCLFIISFFWWIWDFCLFCSLLEKWFYGKYA